MTAHLPVRRTFWTILRENALQLLMYLVGTLLVGLVTWPLGLVYLVYSILSNYMYMAWVCVYCAHYTFETCAAGFDILSGKRFKPLPGRTFGNEYRRRSWVLYPGWFLPPLAGLYLLFFHFSWLAVALLAAFSAVAFWLLPVDARRHCEGCATLDCPRNPNYKKA